MKKYTLLLLISVTFSFIIIAPDNPKESNFSGAYVSIALQFGKDNNSLKFNSYQINLGIPIKMPFMAGLTVGKRNYKNGQQSYYIDLQGNIIFLGGFGIGLIKENKEIYKRKKIFGGCGPVMFSRDWFNKKNEIIKNQGIIISAPILTIYGNKFHP